MSTALMRVCETGCYETAKQLIEEFEEFGGVGLQKKDVYNVDFKIKRIFMDKFLGKTVEEKKHMIRNIESCDGVPFDKVMYNFVFNDEKLEKFIAINPGLITRVSI